MAPFVILAGLLFRDESGPFFRVAEGAEGGIHRKLDNITLRYIFGC